MIMRNYQRLTVNLFNVESKKDFKTTYTYNNITSELDAINLIWTMHSAITDNNHDLSRKVIKATYNGKLLSNFGNSRPPKHELIVK